MLRAVIRRFPEEHHGCDSERLNHWKPWCREESVLCLCVYRLTKEPLKDRVLIINADHMYYVYESDYFRKLATPEVEDYALQPPSD